MAAGDMEQFARIAAIAAGIVFGGWALSSVIWVWTKKQIYAYGGSALSVVGVILMGLSIYKTVDVHAATDGIGIKLSEMEKLLKEQGQAQQETQSKLASFPADLGQKIAELDKTVKAQGNAQATQFRMLEDTNSMIQRASVSKDPSRDSYWLFPQGTGSPAKLAIGAKQPDGTLLYSFFPDPADPKYTATLQQQIDKVRKEKGSNSPELSRLLMKLGDSYQEQGKLADAEATYAEGLNILRTQSRKLNASEPEKK